MKLTIQEAYNRFHKAVPNSPSSEDGIAKEVAVGHVIPDDQEYWLFSFNVWCTVNDIEVPQ